MNAQPIDLVNEPTVEQWAGRINGLWQTARESAFEIGQSLIEAKAALPPGQFQMMVVTKLDFSPRWAQQLMKIARNPQLVKAKHASHLPQSSRSLTILGKFAIAQPERFDRAVETGAIHPEMSEADCEALRAPTRPTRHVEARSPDELRTPITDADELLATMIGYRKLSGESQMLNDDISGLHEGYTGKLEVDMKRAINPSWWSWLGARNLVMLLVPITGATANRTKCPCCEQPLSLRRG